MRTIGHTAAIIMSSDGTAPMGTRIRGPVSAALDRKKYLKVLSLSRVSLLSTMSLCCIKQAYIAYAQVV